MKRFLLLSLLSTLGAAPASAASCVSGTLQSYVDLGSGGCAIGAVQLADFAIAPGQTFATPIDPATILVTPGGTAIVPTVTLTLVSSAGAGDLLEAFFRFSATSTDLIEAAISMSGASATGDGAVTATQDVCPDGAFQGAAPLGCPSAPLTLIAFATELDAQLAETASFAPAAFLDVFADLVVDGGPSGSASLGSATLSFGVVPEQSVAALLTAGLAVLARMRRQRAH